MEIEFNSTNQEGLQEIVKIPFFYDLSQEDLEELSQIIIIHKQEPNRYIFKEGDIAEGMFFLLEGSIKIKKKLDNQEEILLAELNPPAFFGEMALIDGRRRAVSAIALTDITFAELSCSDFEKLTTNNPALAVNVIRKIAHTLCIKLRKIGIIYDGIIL